MTHPSKRVHHARRGRPKSIRPERDAGTPELQRKRQQHLTMEMLDVYLERGIITANQHRAALRFRWLYTIRHGSPNPHAVNYNSTEQRTRMRTDEWREQCESEYRECMASLRCIHCAETVINAAVFNLPLLTSEHLFLLRSGLDDLAKHQSNRQT